VFNDVTCKQEGPFAWPKGIQGHILGSFFYGYLISQIPSGLFAEHFGAKWVLIVFLGTSTVGTLLTPVAARLSYWLLIALRVLVGIGSVSPAQTFISQHCDLPHLRCCSRHRGERVNVNWS
jgi:MFS family permease